MNPVRVYLAVLLAAQFMVPLVPSWGAFVPHDHWARAPITPADWSVHVQEHITGMATAAVAPTHSDAAQIISTPSQDGIPSFHAPLADHNSNLEFSLAPRVVLYGILTQEFTARAVSYPPLDPPPSV